MLESSFSVLKPQASSRDFYKNFYNQFSFLQVNDIIMRTILEDLNDDKATELVNSIYIIGEDTEENHVGMIAMGIHNPALNLRIEEERGIDLSTFNKLSVNNPKDALDWYLNTNEFIHTYAICEQALKELMKEQLINIENQKKAYEARLVEDVLNNIKIDKQIFLRTFSNKTNGILEHNSEIITLWKYFTQIRHLFVHSNGKITSKWKDNMNKILTTEKNILNKIESKESFYLEALTFHVDNFFEIDLIDNEILQLTIYQLNFFRNFTITIIECLEAHVFSS